MEKTNVMIERFSDGSFKITTTENIDENEMKRRTTLSALYMNAVQKVGLSVEKCADGQLSIIFPDEEKEEIIVKKKRKTYTLNEENAKSDYLYACKKNSALRKVLELLYYNYNGKTLYIDGDEIEVVIKIAMEQFNVKYSNIFTDLKKKLEKLAKNEHCTLYKRDGKKIYKVDLNFKTNESK